MELSFGKKRDQNLKYSYRKSLNSSTYGFGSVHGRTWDPRPVFSILFFSDHTFVCATFKTRIKMVKLGKIYQVFENVTDTADTRGHGKKLRNFLSNEGTVPDLDSLQELQEFLQSP